jgi:hypothetical protein
MQFDGILSTSISWSHGQNILCLFGHNNYFDLETGMFQEQTTYQNLHAQLHNADQHFPSS